MHSSSTKSGNKLHVYEEHLMDFCATTDINIGNSILKCLLFYSGNKTLFLGNGNRKDGGTNHFFFVQTVVSTEQFVNFSYIVNSLL